MNVKYHDRMTPWNKQSTYREYNWRKLERGSLPKEGTKVYVLTDSGTCGACHGKHGRIPHARVHGQPLRGRVSIAGERDTLGYTCPCIPLWERGERG